jgi:anti-sigma B factor antagonist
MEIDVTLDGDIARVHINGRIVDGRPAEDLTATLSRLHREGRTKTIIDLTDVTWFDSLAIGILVAHYTSTVKRGGRVVLSGANDRVRSLMEVAQIADRFRWYSTADEALRALR